MSRNTIALAGGLGLVLAILLIAYGSNDVGANSLSNSFLGDAAGGSDIQCCACPPKPKKPEEPEEPIDPDPDPDPVPPGSPVCEDGLITCHDNHGHMDCVEPNGCYLYPDDLDPKACMLSVQPGPNETIEHTLERRAKCILESPPFAPEDLQQPTTISFVQTLSPQGSTLAQSTSTTIGVQTGANTTTTPEFVDAITWSVEGVASDSSTLDKSGVALSANFQLEPWDGSQVFSRISFSGLTLTTPSVGALGLLGTGQNVVSLEAAGDFDATGLLDTQSGRFHAFVPFRVDNDLIPGTNSAPWWASVTGTMTDTTVTLQGIHYAHPRGDVQRLLGRDTVVNWARDIIDQIPTGQFTSPAAKTQILGAYDAVMSELALYDDDQRPQLFSVHESIAAQIGPLVDGIVGEDATDDVFPVGGDAQVRALAWIASKVAHDYFYNYYYSSTP